MFQPDVHFKFKLKLAGLSQRAKVPDMKKIVYLVLVMSVLPLRFTVAAENNNIPLIPANSLEEMMKYGVNENATVADFDDYGRPGRDHHVICSARNLRNMHFDATGFDPRETQDEAMRRCERVSRRCFELGCHRI